MLPNLGVAEDNRLEVLRILRTAQADETILAAKMRGFGWNVVGPQYRELHALFLRQYAELNEWIAAAAEGVRVRGGLALTSLTECVQFARLSEAAGRQPAAKDMAAALLADHEALVRSLRQDAADCAAAHLDAGAAAFLTDLTEKHSRTAWGLRAFLETPTG